MINKNFGDAKALAAALAGDVAAILRARIATGPAVLGVSGGTTPVRFFMALANEQLDWRKITVVLTDDRWVPESSRRSNAALVKQYLLQGEAAAAAFVPLVSAHETPEEGLAAAQTALRALPFPMAAVVLGIGTDGHTASLFPGGDRLRQALAPPPDQLVESMHCAAADEPRITLTLPVLLAAEHVIIHIEGETKRHVLEAAMQPGLVEDMPVRAVLAAAPAIYWCA